LSRAKRKSGRWSETWRKSHSPIRLDVPIRPEEMRENTTRARFMAGRTRNVVPLTAPELKALRQLGTPE